MADQFDLRGYMEWDSKLAPGDPVQARWTNSGNYYRVAAHIKTASKSSIRVTLDRDVYGYSTHGPQTLVYQKGREIVVPRGLMTRTWSQNNGAFQPGSAKEIGLQKENVSPRERIDLHRRLFTELARDDDWDYGHDEMGVLDDKALELQEQAEYLAKTAEKVHVAATSYWRRLKPETMDQWAKQVFTMTQQVNKMEEKLRAILNDAQRVH